MFTFFKARWAKRKKRKKIMQLKWPKYQNSKDENMGWTKHKFWNDKKFYKIKGFNEYQPQNGSPNPICYNKITFMINQINLWHLIQPKPCYYTVLFAKSGCNSWETKSFDIWMKPQACYGKCLLSLHSGWKFKFNMYR